MSQDASSNNASEKSPTVLLRRCCAAFRVTSALAVSLLLVACDVAHIQYHYVYVEGEGLRVSDTGRIDPGAIGASKFEDHESMPLRYELSRDSYEIVVWVPTDTYHTRIMITAESRDGDPLLVSGELDDRCTFLTAEHIVDVLSAGQLSPTMSVYWNSGVAPRCERHGVHVNAPFPLVLQVWDPDGQLLGTEALTYTVRPNGVYTAPTAY